MALGSLKDIYYKAEDKWYAALEKIDSKVHVFGVVDRIDDIVPSFALFLIAIALLLLFAVFFLPGMLGAGSVSYSFRIADGDGIAVEGADVQVLAGGVEIFSGQTNASGETGRVSLAPNSKITVKVVKSGFLEYTESITASKSTTPYEITLAGIESKTYTVALKDTLGQPVREPVTLSFQCRNSGVSPPPDITVNSGVATVVEPANCNGLIASVKSSGFEAIDSVELTQAQQTIYLQETVSANAEITAELSFNGQPVGEAVTVYLFQDNSTDAGIGPIESSESEDGKAKFNRQPGTYFVKSSGYGNYGAARSAAFTVAAGEKRAVQLELQKNIVGNVRLRVLDEATKEAVGGAAVLLRLGEREIDTKTTSADSNGIVEFPVTQDTAYTVFIDKEGYCLKVISDAAIGGDARDVLLKPFNSDCGGKLRVKVLDQDGILVRNAAVGLYTSDGFTTGFASHISDVNGIALFDRVPSGDYKAFAFKGASSGWSDAEHFVQRAAEQTILTVVLNVANGTVRASVSDSEGNPLQFAQVAFVDSFTNETIGGGAKPVEDANGRVELLTRADKSVYVVASKQGYANYTSVVLPVLPNSTQAFNVVLEKEIIQGDIKIDFKGIYKDGTSISVLAPGQKYTALFNLIAPANKRYSKIGMHARTGTRSLMELDKIVLGGINAPGRARILRATSYNPQAGYSSDSGNLSTDSAKWANIEWAEFATGIIAVEAEIRVKETAGISDELKLLYRAWGVEDTLYKRDPIDSSLGEAESVAGKEGLYANTKEENFQVGMETQCDQRFCFSANIRDIAEDIAQSATDSYESKIYNAYELKFTLQNNSQYETDNYMDADIQVTNGDEILLLQGYKVDGAQSQAVNGTVNGSGTGWIPVGNLLKKNKINGKIIFTPQKIGSGLLTIKLRSGQRVQFEKSIAINVSSDRQLSVVVAPEMLPSGIQNTITVSVRDKQSNAELNEARVKLKDRFGAVLAEILTNRLGVALLALPALQPADTMQLIVGKAGYEPFTKAITVDKKVITVNPAAIGVSLNAKTKTDAEDAFTAENRTAFELGIKEIRLNGNLNQLVDSEKINNALYGYVGGKIPPGGAKEMRLDTFLSDRGKKLGQAKQLEGTLDITVEANGSEWTESVPVKISIGLGGEVDDPACFSITRKEWKGSTEGNPIEIEFEVQNNCAIEGAPIPLRNIAATVKWGTNQIGTFSIRTESGSVEIQSGYSKKFIGTIEPEKSVSAVLQFAPDAGVNGKGTAEIAFQAENPTETGAQLLTDKLEAEIVAVNLADCISFSKEVLVIQPQKSDKFAVETVGCGAKNEIKLESDLTLSANKLSLGEKDSKEVEVLAEKNMPGQYPIKVFAKGADQQGYKFIKMIRARISSSKCIELSRYEFNIFDNPENPYDGYDTAEVANKCYDQPLTIHVKFDEHDWGDALKTGLLVGLVSMLMTSLSNGAKGLSPFGGSSVSAASNAVNGGATAGITEGGKEVKLQDGVWVDSVSGNRVTGAVYPYMQVDGKWGYYQEQKSFWGGKKWVPAPEAATKPKPPAAKPAAPAAGSPVVPATPPTTGWAEGVPAMPATAPAGFAGLLGGSGSSGMSGMELAAPMMMGMGQSSGGYQCPIMSGLMGTLMGAMWAYSQQEEGEFSFNTIDKDLVKKGFALLMPGATWEDKNGSGGSIEEAPSEDIVVQDLKESSTEPREDNPKLNVEYMKIGFVNKGKVVQPDPATPLFRVLRFDGERLKWETEYEVKENKQPKKLKVKERKDYKESFRLQFNSFNPMDTNAGVAPPIPNCKLGNVVGNTGPSAVPRVSYSWDWGSIADNACDEGNQDYVYCDATQFSIEVLKKLQRLKQFIAAYGPFDCPSPESAVAVRQQPMVLTAYDVGITRIQSNRVGGSDANVIVAVESNNGKQMGVEVTVDVKNSMTGTLAGSCTKQASLLSKVAIGCEFRNLAAGLYDVNARMAPTLCAGCENSDPSNDRIGAQLFVGSTGIVECTPVNTKRLPLFIEATEAAGHAGWTTQERDAILKAVKFNAYLMRDALNEDFRKDFDMFCKTKSFFDCPAYYTEDGGLHKLFGNSSRFKFDYGMPPNAPLEAGKYSITLNIEFENTNWGLFSNNEPSATVNVEMAALGMPAPDSPLYYLPFDGLVGVNSMNGRQGYGVNFRQTGGDSNEVKINNSIELPVIATMIPNSTPIFGGWVEASYSSDFKRLNLDKRGILLDVQTGSEAARLTFSPSYATPIIMKVDYNKGSNAYAFYSVEVDGTPQTAFDKMIPWSGIGAGCRDFEDKPVTEAWQGTWDTHGGISGNLMCALGTDITDYGVEWCAPARKGSVSLESVVFTPQGKSSIISRTVYSDEMMLIGTDNRASQLALNGVPGMEFNYSLSGVDSIENVLELVRQGKVCVIGQGSRISSQFFWNPKVVLQEIAQQRSSSAAGCIGKMD